jgi:hypothetical protein
MQKLYRDNEVTARGFSWSRDPIYNFSRLLPILTLLSILLLCLHIGYTMKSTLINGPIFHLMGGFASFPILVVSLIMKLVYWALSGNIEPAESTLNFLPFANEEMRAVFALLPFGFVVGRRLFRFFVYLHLEMKTRIVVSVCMLLVAITLLISSLEIFSTYILLLDLPIG